jgi:hypothetical protein
MERYNTGRRGKGYRCPFARCPRAYPEPERLADHMRRYNHGHTRVRDRSLRPPDGSDGTGLASAATATAKSKKRVGRPRKGVGKQQQPAQPGATRPSRRTGPPSLTVDELEFRQAMAAPASPDVLSELMRHRQLERALAYVQRHARGPYFRPDVDADTATAYRTLAGHVDASAQLIEHLAALMECSRRCA